MSHWASNEAIQIPPERLVPIATEAASNAKAIGSVVCFFLGLFAIAGIGLIADSSASSTTGKTMDGGSTIVGLAVWFVVLGAIASKFLTNAKRASAAARSAARTPDAYSYVLSGKLLVVSDAAGLPQPDRSFKLSRKLRTMLLAVPQATVVDSDR